LIDEVDSGPEADTSEAVSWFKQLTPNQRITIKEEMITLCGVGWSDVNFLFKFDVRLNLVYQKLIQVFGYNPWAP